MKKLGIYLVIAGLGSFLLNMIGYEFRLLMWIDTWGPTTGMLIRGGAVVLGAVMIFAGGKSQPNEVVAEPVESPPNPE